MEHRKGALAYENAFSAEVSIGALWFVTPIVSFICIIIKIREFLDVTKPHRHFECVHSESKGRIVLIIDCQYWEIL